ncbi:MAG: U32 family peptidase [Defluviitaleaceae bacterium]|nr:U32 family peptidase [Defluviitaleaceae bacterium]
MKKPEILSPAGDLERLKVALAYGADAVYIGGKTLSMRAKAKNFSEAEMEEGIFYAHSLGRRVYVALNICAHNDDFKKLDEYLLWLEEIKADALLISDPGVFLQAKKTVPKMEIHISTQANIANYNTAKFWHDLGAKRAVLARELSIGEIREIHEKAPDIEIETFVHGAMCMAYSGRCLISNFLNARDANRGECSQPCRFSYALVEEKSGEIFPVTESSHGTFLFNSKDLCMVNRIPDLATAGITSLKIEGRMKTEYYVGATTKLYREAIDDYFQSPSLYAEKLPHYQREAEKIGNRGYTTGFFYGKPTGADHDYKGEYQAASQDFLAIIQDYNPDTRLCKIEQRNKFSVGDKVEILRANAPNFCQAITEIYDEAHNKLNSAPHPKQSLFIKLDYPVAKYDMIRKGENLTPYPSCPPSALH